MAVFGIFIYAYPPGLCIRHCTYVCNDAAWFMTAYFHLQEKRKTVSNHPDEIKSIYSLYKVMIMTCSLTHIQAQVP